VFGRSEGFVREVTPNPFLKERRNDVATLRFARGQALKVAATSEPERNYRNREHLLAIG
jgi:hypothetical protein